MTINDLQRYLRFAQILDEALDEVLPRAGLTKVLSCWFDKQHRIVERPEQIAIAIEVWRKEDVPRRMNWMNWMRWIQ